MSKFSKEFCERAIAYIKPNVSHAPVDEAITPVSGIPTTEYPVITDLNNGLLVAYLYSKHEEENFTYIKHQDLIDAEISQTDLHASAVRNLSTFNNNTADVRGYDNHFKIFFDVNFGASLLLIDRLWDEEFATVTPNGIILAVPNREVLAFCDAHSILGIQELRAFIERANNLDAPIGNHPITEVLYIRDSQARIWRHYVN